MIYSVLFTLTIVYLNGISRPGQIASKFEKIGISRAGGEFIRRATLKPLLYYYQALSCTFLNSGVVIHLMAFIEIFSFQFEFGRNNGKTSGFCWIKGLTAKYEILLNLVVPIFCSLTLIIMGILYKIKVYEVKKRKPYFIKSFISILLLFIGTISGICFKLIACRNIDNFSVHFYFGVDECYDFTWFIALSIIIFLILLFCWFGILLYRDHTNLSSQHLMILDEYVLESLVKSYNTEKYWYWELVLFSRRIIIAMINVLTDSIIAKNTLFILIFIYLLAQINCNPFRIKQINTLDTVCLCCLLMSMYILSNGVQDNLSLVILNFILLLPFILFIIQFCKINRKAFKDKKNRPTTSYRTRMSSALALPFLESRRTTTTVAQDKDISLLNMVLELVPKEATIIGETKDNETEMTLQ